MRIVVAGGGYSGLACLMELRRRMDDAELVLLDPEQDHLKITHLHETVRRPLQDYRAAYARLGRRNHFEHIAAKVDYSNLEAIAATSAIKIPDGSLDFDFLVLATGATPPKLPKGEFVFDRDDLRAHDLQDILANFLSDTSRPRQITVVGGGPSGIQVLFELVHQVRAIDRSVAFRLVDRAASLLEGQPRAMASYVIKKIEQEGIEYSAATEYQHSADGMLQLKSLATGQEISVASGLTLLFPGVSPKPELICDRFGRMGDFKNVYAAGDCARFHARGDDQLTAQVAVRQGKLVAQNIDRLSRGARPLEYYFKELGYVVSLGPMDAVGWLLSKKNIVHGLPAFAIKEVIEAQYDLFVAGVDTYII